MPDSNNFSDFDFELPPLPKVPLKTVSGGSEISDSEEIADEEVEKALGTLPAKPVEDELACIDREIDTSGLPELPQKTVDDELSAAQEVSAEELPEAVSEPEEDLVSEIEAPDTGVDEEEYELPPIPVRKPDEAESKAVSEDVFDFNADQPEEEDETEETFDFEDDYNLDSITSDSVNIDDIKAELSELRTGRESNAKNIKEAVKLNDMMMEMGTKPILDDLSHDYVEPHIKAKKARTSDILDEDEKKALKQQLAEDLQSRPVHFSQRASNAMANKLLEQKKMKIAKKGFWAVFLCILLGIGSAAVSYLFLNRGVTIWFTFVAVAMVFAALILFIKSKMAKRLSMVIYVLSMAAYIIPGFIMYLIDPGSSSDEDFGTKLTMYIIAALCNLISIIVLNKSEAVEMYYTVKVGGKR